MILNEKNKMENLSPKELYELKKKEKFNSQEKGKSFNHAKKYLVWLVILAVLVAGIYWFASRAKEKVDSRKIYAVQVIDQGRNHISIGVSHPDYNSNPPTSGWHYEKWKEKGVYKEQQPDEAMIHNLEHGYIWISYRPNASPEIIKQLENFYGFGKKIVVEPRKENDKMIVLAAWNWLDKFDPVSNDSLGDTELKRIGDFIDQYINQGPEPNAP